MSIQHLLLVFRHYRVIGLIGLCGFAVALADAAPLLPKSVARLAARSEAPPTDSRQARGGAAGEVEEVGLDVILPDGKVYDFFVLTGKAAEITADAGQVARVYFLDLDGDLVEVDFSGAGTLSISLEPATGPAAPLKYNSVAEYMSGLAAITVQASDATTNLAIRSAGRADSANQSLFRDDVAYDGVADISRVTIVAADGGSAFGKLEASNVRFTAREGVIGVSAANVTFGGAILVGDITAFGTALPVMSVGGGSAVQVAGGSLLQNNGKPLVLDGIDSLTMGSGSNSHGVFLPAQTNRAVVVPNGSADVTPRIISSTAATFTAGEPGSFRVTALGSPAPTYSIVAGTLPAWATLDATTGVVSGTPSDLSGAPYSFRVQASNGIGVPAVQSFTLDVLGPLSVAPLANQTVTAGNSVTWTASASGDGEKRYQWRHDGQPIAGATSASFTLASAKMPDAGSYDVVVYRDASRVVSGPSILSVAPMRYPGIMRVDPTFTPLIEADAGNIYSIVRQPDGKLIVAGQFSRINGVARSNVARLEATGEVDESFDPREGPNGIVESMALQPDGKILLAGYFTAVDGVVRGHVARLNGDGSLDPTFDPRGGSNGGIVSLALQSDGKVLLVGSFETYSGESRPGLVRINADGSIDAAFHPVDRPSAYVARGIVQPDGKILITGQFSKFGSADRLGLARLNVDGSLDDSFVPNTATNFRGSVLKLQSDGKILVGGANHDSSIPDLLRLNANGSRDDSFTTGVVAGVTAVFVQTDGKIVVGGQFSSAGGMSRKRVARLLANGSLDESFDPGQGVTLTPTDMLALTDGSLVASGDNLFASTTNAMVHLGSTGTLDGGFNAFLRAQAEVREMIRQPDGKILISGAFDYIDNTRRSKVARLNGDGSLDVSFSAGPILDFGGGAQEARVDGMVRQPDGRIVIGGFFASVAGKFQQGFARLNLDGSLDPTFVHAEGGASSLAGMTFQRDGKILVVGGSSPKGLMRLNADGSLDSGFSLTADFQSHPSAIAVQDDGRIVVGGLSYVAGGAQHPGIMRVLADGSRDDSFFPSLAPSRSVQAIAIAQNGASIIAVDGTPGGLYRLGPDGFIDSGFANVGLASYVRAVGTLSVQADGRILAGSSAASGDVPPFPPGLVRVTTSGAVDPNFGAPELSNASISRIITLESGDLLVAGKRFNDGTVDQMGVARLTRRTTPVFTSADHAAFAVGAAGAFTVSASGTPRPNISVSDGDFPVWATLNTATGEISGTPSDEAGSSYSFTLRAGNDGDVNTTQTFTLTVAPASVTVSALEGKTVTAGEAVQWDAGASGTGPFTYQWRRDGLPIVGATLSTYTIGAATMLDAGRYDVVVTGAGNVTVRSGAATLLVAPTQYPRAMKIDPTFAPVIEANGGTVSAIVRQPDGKFLVGGTFSRINGMLRRNLARLKTDGTVDPAFDPGAGPDGAVSALLLLPTGKVMVGGDFSTFNKVARGNIALVNSDGSLDESFDPGSGTNDEVTCFALQGDGAILVGGWFTKYNGATCNRILRLDASGARDTAFSPGSGATSGITALALQSDGAILAAGFYSQWNGKVRQGLVRLQADGALDESFVPETGSDYSAYALAIQSDGKIVVGADNFGNSAPNLLRLNSNGSRDGSFSPISLRGVHALLIQSDGKLIVGGPFGTYNGAPANHVLRLTSTGTLDGTFNAGSGIDFHTEAMVLDANEQVVAGGRFLSVEDSPRSALARLKTTGIVDVSFAGNVRSPGTVETVLRQRDGKYLIGGVFDFVNGVSRKRLARLNADGTLDLSFNCVVTLVNGVTGALTEVSALVAQPDGNILVGGFFDRINGEVRSRIARIHPDGSNDGSFNPGAGASSAVDAIALLPDGRILIGGLFSSYDGKTRNRLARLNANGSLDTGFDPGTGPNSIVFAIDPLPDGRAVIGGWFTSYAGVIRRTIARVMPDGSLDGSFGGEQFNVFSSYGFIEEPSGMFLVADRNRLWRLGSDGLVDATYAAADVAIVGSIGGMTRQADGRVLVGQATSSSTDQLTVGLARINDDGTGDDTFSVIGLKGAHADAIVMLENGDLVIGGGEFTDGKIVRGGLARLVRIEPALIEAQPQSQAVPDSGLLLLSAKVSGEGPFTYQWRKNGNPIEGANDAVLVVDQVSADDAGDYTVAVTNDAGTTISGAATITVTPPVAPSVTKQPVSQSVSAGAGFKLTVGVTGTPPYTYQWRLNGSPIEGAVEASYEVAASNSEQAGEYTVEITNRLGAAISDPATVTVIPAGFAGAQAVVGAGFVPGGTVTITNTVTHPGGLTGLGWQVLLPEGWSYVSSEGKVGESGPQPGDTGFLEWAWISIPGSPFTFSYTLRIPAEETKPREIAALMLPRQGTQYTILVKPDPLLVERIEYHTADLDHDARLALPELLRVIELYNTRNGTVRTGAYAVDPGNPDDGFAPEPERANAAVVTLARYHSADSDRDGKLGLAELLRVIELYNYRSGTVRTGQYHVRSDTEDGFEAGP